MPCDCILFEGFIILKNYYNISQNKGDCICDEAILTGESLPITKRPLNQNK